jgi:hypothetical protein
MHNIEIKGLNGKKISFNVKSDLYIEDYFYMTLSIESYGFNYISDFYTSVEDLKKLKLELSSFRNNKLFLLNFESAEQPIRISILKPQNRSNTNTNLVNISVEKFDKDYDNLIFNLEFESETFFIEEFEQSLSKIL